ncbi:BPSL0761 family protein [Vreelandella neptunia]|uniref:BPSL0761 family protein n=1 Tax=Vreelandella neptunia TaxID=115551 RepID=UPI0027962221|nr:BPSL0761 family protein [Halomonas neptunia]
MPSERKRSVIQTREFLIELNRNTDFPETIRRQAKQLLRHYPSQIEMLDAGQLEEHLTGRTIILQSIFSSAIEGL